MSENNRNNENIASKAQQAFKNNPQIPSYAFSNKALSSTIINTNTSDNKNYIGPRYATGDPFPNFRDYAGRMTQNYPVSLDNSTNNLLQNLPTDNTLARDATMRDAINMGNKANRNWVYTSQTLGHPTSTLFCTSTTDCSPLGPMYECNSNYSPWNDSYGNQSGSVCTFTAYPELASGNYTRLDSLKGGIGKTCYTDNDCNKEAGYSCNNTVDPFGKNIQQTGYCSQTYECADGSKRYLGYPYNSGIPVIPPKNQNNNGMGYTTLDECSRNALAQQNCVLQNGKYFATYPGYCPIQPTARVGGPAGALSKTSSEQLSRGFEIPAYATNRSSFIGSAKQSMSLSLSGFNKYDSMKEPLDYEMKINPIPGSE